MTEQLTMISIVDWSSTVFVFVISLSLLALLKLECKAAWKKCETPQKLQFNDWLVVRQLPRRQVMTPLAWLIPFLSLGSSGAGDLPRARSPSARRGVSSAFASFSRSFSLFPSSCLLRLQLDGWMNRASLGNGRDNVFSLFPVFVKLELRDAGDWLWRLAAAAAASA